MHLEAKYTSIQSAKEKCPYFKFTASALSNSSVWNFEMMKLNESWIHQHQLFSEEHWVMDEHPLWPPIRFSVYMRHAFFKGELIDENLESPLKKKTCGIGVRLEGELKYTCVGASNCNRDLAHLGSPRKIDTGH